MFPRARLTDPGAEGRAFRHTFFVGKKLDARDSVNSWCSASVVQVAASRVLIRYDGWSSKWDEWIEITSDRYADADARVLSHCLWFRLKSS